MLGGLASFCFSLFLHLPRSSLAVWGRKKREKQEVRETWFLIQSLPLIGQVTLGKLFNITEPHKLIRRSKRNVHESSVSGIKKCPGERLFSYTKVYITIKSLLPEF